MRRTAHGTCRDNVPDAYRVRLKPGEQVLQELLPACQPAYVHVPAEAHVPCRASAFFCCSSCMRSTQELCMSLGAHSRLHWMSRQNSAAYADAWKCTLHMPRYEFHRAAEQPGSMTLLQKTQAHLVRAHKREQLQRDGHSGRRPYSPGPYHCAAEAVHRNVKERPKRAGLRATGAVELARRNSPPTRRLQTLLTSHAKLTQQQHGCQLQCRAWHSRRARRPSTPSRTKLLRNSQYVHSAAW